MQESYIRYVTRGHRPFNPIELAVKTREIVCRQRDDGAEARKYTHFYVVWVYQGISTAYTVGCNLRCVFCWTDPSRDFPERYGRLYGPDDVVERLVRNASRHNVDRVRISGGEPTICRDHLLQVMDICDRRPEVRTFLLETNGILLGWDESYVKDVAQFRKVVVRVSIKAALPDEFARRTGAMGEFYELPFRAIRSLLKHGVETYVAAMTDPRLMSARERETLFERLAEIDPELAQTLEEENVDPYRTSLFRLREAGLNIF